MLAALTALRAWVTKMQNARQAPEDVIITEWVCPCHGSVGRPAVMIGDTGICNQCLAALLMQHCKTVTPTKRILTHANV